MKRILTFVFLLCSLGAFAQTNPQYNSVRLVGSDSTSGTVTVNGTMRFNPVSGTFRFRQGGTWVGLGAGASGSSTFVGLTDGPGSFSGKTLNYFRVNAGETALEYRTPANVRSDIGAQATITFGTGVQTALGVNVGSAGAPILFNGAGGTPSSINVANATGFPTLNQNTTGSAATLTTPRNINGVAFNGSANITITAEASGKYVFDQVTATTTGGTITLDMNSQIQRMFLGSASFATSKIIAFSNTTNSLVFNFQFEITNIAGTLTFPSGTTMADSHYASLVWTATTIGKYEMGGSFDGANWKVKIVGPFL